MRRHLYSIVRVLPHPRTGEFVNVGALAGDPAADDWAVRRVGPGRALAFAGPTAFCAGMDFLDRLTIEIEQGSTLGEEWLQRLHHDHRGVVQLSAPAPMLAMGPGHALDVIFGRLVVYSTPV